MEKSNDRRVDSVARAMKILSDRWIFLILRECFFGVKYYDQFLANLDISTNILSDRLTKLVQNGLLNKASDENDARRYRYTLTEKGRDVYPIALAYIAWGDKWLTDGDEPPLILYHKKCGKKININTACSACGDPIAARDVYYAERYKKDQV